MAKHPEEIEQVLERRHRWEWPPHSDEIERVLERRHRWEWPPHSEDSAPTLCRRCWCVTWTSDLGRCGKCDARKSVVHRSPLAGQGTTPCCERNPLELPIWDRITTDPAAVTCEETP